MGGGIVGQFLRRSDQIHRVRLEAAGENIIFGGDPTGIPGLVPSNILIEENTLYKPLSWRGVFRVKNSFELKNARHVIFRHNHIKHCWMDSQVGWAIVLTPSPSGSDSWAHVEDVLIEWNHIEGAAGVVNALGIHRTGLSSGNRRITIANNLCRDISRR
jgi:hypothetical protein